jgi:hypothetical protein
MMSKTVDSDNRKRPWDPKLNPLKKAKKLSPLAERALAALDDEHADGGSLSSSCDHEKGDSPHTNSQYKKIPRASSDDLSDGGSDKSIEEKCSTEQSTINTVTDLTGGGEDDDDEIVVPHHPLSDYGNVLSCFLSTPFDRNEMLSLYLLKEGKRAGRQKQPMKNGEGGDHHLVPILPQKYFTTNNSMKVTTYTGMLSQSSGINQGSLVEQQSNTINNQVSQFLMDECRKTNDETDEQLTTIDNHHGEDDGRKTSQDVLPCQSEPYEEEILPQQYQHQLDQHESYEEEILSQYYQHQHDQQQQQRTYQHQMDEAQHYQYQPDYQHTSYQQQMQSYYFGPTLQYQSPYYPMQHTMHPLQRATNWQYDSHPYAAAPPAPAPTLYNNNNNGISMPLPYNSYNSLAFAAAQHQQQQQYEHQVQYNETHQRVEKAQAATESVPQKAQAASVTVPKVIRRENNNDIESQPQDSVSHPKPKIALANEVIDLVTSNSEQNSVTSNCHETTTNRVKSSIPVRTSTTPIESSKTPPGLPCGWTSKTFQRMSGRSSGSTDTYYYSPNAKIKFRSMKKCYIFIEILKDVNIDGNESAALNEFKKRGHKL